MDECVASEGARGKPSGYDAGCRCWKCSTAKSIRGTFYHAENREAILPCLRAYGASPAGRLGLLLRDAKQGKLISRERIERVKQEYKEAYLDGHVA